MTGINQNNNNLAFGVVSVRRFSKALRKMGAEVSITHDTSKRQSRAYVIDKNGNHVYKPQIYNSRAAESLDVRFFPADFLNSRKSKAKGKKAIANVLSKGDRLLDSKGKTIAIV